MSREKSMTDEAVERKLSSQCANLKSIILYSSKKKKKNIFALAPTIALVVEMPRAFSSDQSYQESTSS